MSQGDARHAVTRAVETSGVATAVTLRTDLDGTIVAASPAAVRLLGAPVAEVVGSSLYERLSFGHDFDISRLIVRLLREGREEAWARAWHRGAREREGELRLCFRLTRDGSGAPGYLDVTTSAAMSALPLPIVDARPQLPATSGSVGAPVAVAVALPDPVGPGRDTAEWLVRLLDAIGDLVLLFDDGGSVREANRAATRLFGLAESGRHARSLYDSVSLEVLRAEVAPAVARGEPWHGPLRMVTAEGIHVAIHQTLVAASDDNGRGGWIAMLGQDVTEHDLLAGELLHRATRDPLTGLLNRASILEEIDRRLLSSRQRGTQVAVGFFDLDRFKGVNDRYGHSVGDQLLKHVAVRIGHSLRDSDVAGRLGGDEFLVVIDPVGEEGEARVVLERAARSISSDPVRIGEVDVAVTASVGVALAGPSCRSETMVRDADAAMYLAKNQGRDRIELFDADMRDRVSERNRVLEELRVALDEGQIGIELQPTFDLHAGTLLGAEALARWFHPVRGMVSPGEFIGLAEDSGLITRLGLTVLHLAGQAVARWAELVEHPPPIHVNVSPRQLQMADFVDLAEGVVRGCGVEPAQVVLEITESVLVDAELLASGVFDSLHQRGFRLALDDFGSGYSSLSYLKDFPVDTLKIDRAFVDPITDDSTELTVVSAIVNLAHTLGMHTIAEGVERPLQAALLRRIGCDAVQGFLFGKPMSPEDFERLLLVPELAPDRAGRVTAVAYRF